MTIECFIEVSYRVVPGTVACPFQEPGFLLEMKMLEAHPETFQLPIQRETIWSYMPIDTARKAANFNIQKPARSSSSSWFWCDPRVDRGKHPHESRQSGKRNVAVVQRGEYGVVVQVKFASRLEYIVKAGFTIATRCLTCDLMRLIAVSITNIMWISRKSILLCQESRVKSNTLILKNTKLERLAK